MTLLDLGSRRLERHFRHAEGQSESSIQFRAKTGRKRKCICLTRYPHGAHRTPTISFAVQQAYCNHSGGTGSLMCSALEKTRTSTIFSASPSLTFKKRTPFEFFFLRWAGSAFHWALLNCGATVSPFQ